MISEKNKGYLYDLMKTALPIWFFYFFLVIRTNINIFFVSNNYSDYRLIEGIGLIELYLNCSIYIVITGICGGVEIIGSNFFGDKNYYQVGITANKGKLIAFIYYIFAVILNYLFGLKIIKALFVADEETMILITPYFYLMLFYHLFLLSFNIDIRFLSIIGKSEINNKILIASTIVQFFLNYIFLIKYELGLVGIGITNCILQIFCTGGLSFYINYINPFPLANCPFNKECFSNWKEYLKICLPATLILFAEWMGFELQSLIIIRYSSLDYTIHIIFVNIQLMIFTFTLAINISMAINVAKKIVEYSREKLIDFVKICYIFNLIGVIILLFVLFFFQEILINNMTVGNEMKNLANKSFWILYIFLFFDNNNFFFVGTLKGLAYLMVPVIIYIADSYLLVLNLSYFLTFSADFGVLGLWIGMAIGTVISSFSMCYLYCRIDLKKMKAEAMERINKNKNDNRKSSKQLLISKFDREMDVLKFTKKNYSFSNRIYNDEL